MIKGFYASASSMIAQQRRTEMLTNNLANVNTAGYKTDEAVLRSFPQLLMNQYNESDVPNTSNIEAKKTIGSLNPSVYMQEAIPNFSQGDIYETNTSTDLALVDQSIDGTILFFAVQDNSGAVKYTRNGNFSLDNQGYLVTKEGNYVLDSNNDYIQISTGILKVNRAGDIFDDNTLRSKIQVVMTEDATSFVKEENGLYRNVNGAIQPAYGETPFTIEQGFLEKSNVDVNTVMTNLMSAYRLFESNQKILQQMDQNLGKAVNEIGKI